MGKKSKEAERKSAGQAPGEPARPAQLAAPLEPSEPSESAESAEPARISDAPLPLLELKPDYLGGFLELCFPDQRLLELCRELKLTTPGYRLENLPPDQVARILGDEVRAAKDAQALIDREVRAALQAPALESQTLAPDDLFELVDLLTLGDPLVHLACIAWKGLLDPATKDAALEVINVGIDTLDAPAKKKRSPVAPPPPGRKEAEEAVKRADRAEKDRAAAKEQLAAARAEISLREQKMSEQKAELEKSRADLSRLSAEVSRLGAAGEGRALADARRNADQARSLGEKLKLSEAVREELAARLLLLERRAAQPVASPKLAEEDLPTLEESAEFLVPVFTREFYDSIDRWDRRMQRAAFDKVNLLAHDWRHGSLRALALEGVPGYYRIRIATDVRLIYRRDGGRLEILSLIDREDLDRYIRQARTRQA